jgi:hypothetical protein
VPPPPVPIAALLVKHAPTAAERAARERAESSVAADGGEDSEGGFSGGFPRVARAGTSSVRTWASASDALPLSPAQSLAARAVRAVRAVDATRAAPVIDMWNAARGASPVGSASPSARAGGVAPGSPRYARTTLSEPRTLESLGSTALVEAIASALGARALADPAAARESTSILASLAATAQTLGARESLLAPFYRATGGAGASPSSPLSSTSSARQRSSQMTQRLQARAHVRASKPRAPQTRAQPPASAFDYASLFSAAGVRHRRSRAQATAHPNTAFGVGASHAKKGVLGRSVALSLSIPEQRGFYLSGTLGTICSTHAALRSQPDVVPHRRYKWLSLRRPPPPPPMSWLTLASATEPEPSALAVAHADGDVHASVIAALTAGAAALPSATDPHPTHTQASRAWWDGARAGTLPAHLHPLVAAAASSLSAQKAHEMAALAAARRYQTPLARVDDVLDLARSNLAAEGHTPRLAAPAGAPTAGVDVHALRTSMVASVASSLRASGVLPGADALPPLPSSVSPSSSPSRAPARFFGFPNNQGTLPPAAPVAAVRAAVNAAPPQAPPPAPAPLRPSVTLSGAPTDDDPEIAMDLVAGMVTCVFRSRAPARALAKRARARRALSPLASTSVFPTRAQPRSPHHHVRRYT